MKCLRGPIWPACGSLEALVWSNPGNIWYTNIIIKSC